MDLYERIAFVSCHSCMLEIVVYWQVFFPICCVFGHKFSLFLIVCLICPCLPAMYWNAPYYCVQIFACWRTNSWKTWLFALTNTMFFFVVVKLDLCFSEAALLCVIEPKHSPLVWRGGSHPKKMLCCTPPQYFSVSVVSERHRFAFSGQRTAVKAPYQLSSMFPFP